MSMACGRLRWQCWFFILGASLAVGCSDPVDPEVEVTVSRVALDPNSRSPVVLLENQEHMVALPIWIGPAEAQAIAMRLQGITTPRPLTHDLMKDVLDRVGVGLRKVVIGELRDNTYYARLVLLWRGEEVEIDSRPSDAIALAVRFGQPIFVSAALLEQDNVIDLRGIVTAQTMTLGGVTVQGLSRELAEYFQLPLGNGVVVSDVTGDVAGPLRRGDVILEVDGNPVLDLDDFQEKLGALGARADLAVHREGHQIHVAFEPVSAQAAD